MTTVDVERYRALFESVVPGAAPSRVAFLGEGWDNVVFLINVERIARFAKDARTARMLETEAALLRIIGPLLPVPVPQPEIVARPLGAPDIALMVYRRIDGVPLDQVALDDALVMGIAPSLAAALDALHGIAATALDTLEIPRFTAGAWVERHRTLYQRTRDDVRDGLSAQAFERYEAWWRDYLSEPIYRDFEPCLVHGDLASEHLLVEAESKMLRGIIDFGDAMWADPVLDLAALPDPVARAVVAGMNSMTADRGVWLRRASYRRIAPLHAVFAGRELTRPDLLESGIEALRRLTSS